MLEVCANFISSGGIYPGGICPRGYMSWRVSVQRGSVRGVRVQRISVREVYFLGARVQGSTFPGRLCPRTVYECTGLNGQLAPDHHNRETFEMNSELQTV